MSCAIWWSPTAPRRSMGSKHQGDYGKKSSLKIFSLSCPEGQSFDYGEAGLPGTSAYSCLFYLLNEQGFKACTTSL